MFRALVSILAISILGLTSGCGDPAVKASAKTLEVRLGYFANITHAQALVGIQRGDFKNALRKDTTVKPLVFNAGPAAVEALFAGELDLAYIGPGPAINAFVKSKGKAARILAGSAANGVVIVARKDSGITKLADLKGKHIATPQFGNTQDISARAYVIEKLNDKPKDEGGTTTIDAVANAEQLVLFKKGQLDAAWAPEPWGARLIHEAGATLLEEEKNLWEGKQFAITVLLVSQKFYDAHPAEVEALLKAHAELTDFINKSPDEAAKLINAELDKLTGKPIPPEILKEALSRTVFTTDPLESTIDRFAEWSFKTGISKSKADLKGLVDLGPLKKALGR